MPSATLIADLRRIRRGIEELLSAGRSLSVNAVRMVTKAYSYDLIQDEIDRTIDRRAGPDILERPA